MNDADHDDPFRAIDENSSASGSSPEQDDAGFGTIDEPTIEEPRPQGTGKLPWNKILGSLAIVSALGTGGYFTRGYFSDSPKPSSKEVKPLVNIPSTPSPAGGIATRPAKPAEDDRKANQPTEQLESTVKPTEVSFNSEDIHKFANEVESANEERVNQILDESLFQLTDDSGKTKTEILDLKKLWKSARKHNHPMKRFLELLLELRGVDLTELSTAEDVSRLSPEQDQAEGTIASSSVITTLPLPYFFLLTAVLGADAVDDGEKKRVNDLQRDFRDHISKSEGASENSDLKQALRELQLAEAIITKNDTALGARSADLYRKQAERQWRSVIDKFLLQMDSATTEQKQQLQEEIVRLTAIDQDQAKKLGENGDADRKQLGRFDEIVRLSIEDLLNQNRPKDDAKEDDKQAFSQQITGIQPDPNDEKYPEILKELSGEDLWDHYKILRDKFPQQKPESVDSLLDSERLKELVSEQAKQRIKAELTPGGLLFTLKNSNGGGLDFDDVLRKSLRLSADSLDKRLQGLNAPEDQFLTEKEAITKTVQQMQDDAELQKFDGKQLIEGYHALQVANSSLDAIKLALKIGSEKEEGGLLADLKKLVNIQSPIPTDLVGKKEIQALIDDHMTKRPGDGNDSDTAKILTTVEQRLKKMEGLIAAKNNSGGTVTPHQPGDQRINELIDKELAERGIPRLTLPSLEIPEGRTSETNRKQAHHLFEQGLEYFRSQSPEAQTAATRCFTDAISLEPRDPVYRYFLGCCLYCEGRPAEGLEQVVCAAKLEKRSDAGSRVSRRLEGIQYRTRQWLERGRQSVLLGF